MEIDGLPLHPLVVHAVVVLGPLAVLAGTALALLPRWRWLMRWVALVLTLVAMGAVFVAQRSGNALLEDRPFLVEGDTPLARLIDTHQERADVLVYLMLAYAVLVVLAFWLLPAPTGLASGRMGHQGRGEAWLGWVLPVALVVVGLVVLVWVVRTGDAGARAVWS